MNIGSTLAFDLWAVKVVTLAARDHPWSLSPFLSLSTFVCIWN